MKRNCKDIVCTIISILWLLFVLPLTGMSQQGAIDSLKLILSKNKNEDTVRVSILLTLARSYDRAGDTTNAFLYTDEAIALSRKLSFKKGEADGLIYRGYINAYSSNTQAAIRLALTALSLYKEINYEPGIANAYVLLSLIYSNNEYLSESIEASYTALEYFEKTGNKNKQAECLATIGFCYYFLDNFDYAFTAFSKAIKIMNEAGMGTSRYAGHSNIYLGNVYLKRNEYEEAIKYDSAGFKIGEVLQDFQVLGNAYYSFGDYLTQKSQDSKFSPDAQTRKRYLDTALNRYYSAVHYGLAAEDYQGSVDAYVRISQTYTRLGNLVKAQEFSDSAMKMAKFVKTKDAFRISYLSQATIDSAAGNFKAAYKHYQLSTQYRDSFMTESNNKRAAQAQLLFEYNKQQSAAREGQLKKDAAAMRTRNLQYAAIGFVLLLAAFLFWNSRQQQKAKAKIEQAYAELKSTQAQLIQSEKMASLGQLTAGIAHEIQNPLNFVNNFSEINNELIDEVKRESENVKNENIAELLNDIFANNEKITLHGKRADSIVKGMLQHSRKSTGEKELADINALADEYLKLVYHGLRAKDKSFNVTMETNYDTSISKIKIIPQDIGRVLLNLYNNAFYAVKAPGSLKGNYSPVVSVATKKMQDKIIITVRDNGSGIPQSIIDKIFQPFFTTKPTGEGTGLGLSLSYDIVKAHGGELTVESKVGEGAEFNIVLPVGKVV